VDPRTLRRTSRLPLGGSPDPITAGAAGRDRANIDLVRDKARAGLSSYLEGGVYRVTQ
jgi:hypothetical protein